MIVNIIRVSGDVCGRRVAFSSYGRWSLENREQREEFDRIKDRLLFQLATVFFHYRTGDTESVRVDCVVDCAEGGPESLTHFPVEKFKAMLENLKTQDQPFREVIAADRIDSTPIETEQINSNAADDRFIRRDLLFQELTVTFRNLLMKFLTEQGIDKDQTAEIVDGTMPTFEQNVARLVRGRLVADFDKKVTDAVLVPHGFPDPSKTYIPVFGGNWDESRTPNPEIKG